MNGLVVDRPACVLEAGAFEKAAKIFQSDSTIDLHESALDDMLELQRIDGAGATQRQEVSPRLGGEPAPLVGPHHSECHRQRQSVIHSGLTMIKETSHTGEPVR